MLACVCAAALWRSEGSSARGGNLTSRPAETRPRHILAADNYWRLNSSPTGRFDASGLLLRDGAIYTINDRGPQLYAISLASNHLATLLPTEFFTLAKVSQGAGPGGRFDCEGIASDEKSQLYICEESRRLVFRTTAAGAKVERLEIDWTPAQAFFRGSINASFEGIAIGGGKMYLANERDQPRIIVVDLASLKVERSFAVDSVGFALGGPHYSDLAFHNGRLFVLDRNHRCILEVDPAVEKVLAEYSFGEMEIAEEFAYRTDYPTGTMEGLAVDDRYFWLVTDNNGRNRFQAAADFRPTLFRCARPPEKKK